MTNYKLQATGSVGFTRWEFPIACDTDDEAIHWAKQSVKDFVGSRCFMSLIVWDMDVEDGRCVAVLSLGEPIVEVKKWGQK